MERNVRLSIVGILPRLQNANIKSIEDSQRKNASLAITINCTSLEELGVSTKFDQETIPNPFVHGVEGVE